MGGNRLKRKIISFLQNRSRQTVYDRIIPWLRRIEKTDKKIQIFGPPFLIYHLMARLEKEGLSLDLGTRGFVQTGGGWKLNENVRIPHKEFRRNVLDILGIPETNCLDVYSMVEGNGFFMQCPEGHYYHSPYTYYKARVVDGDMQPVEFGEWGRLAFLDASAMSYPGFIITEDLVRMHEHCPVCNRPGPVLEPEIRRIDGSEIRGCSEETRNFMNIAGGWL
jgi:long-chain-fatty-acid---luciferin-component ligase